MASSQWYPPSPSSASSDSMDDVLRCAVCLENYSDPRVLSCLHSFCFTCLESMTKLGPSRRHISCPICKKVTLVPSPGVSSLPNDFKLEQFREVLMRQSTNSDLSEKNCDYCMARSNNTTAEFHCVHCALYLCTECHERHSSNTQLASHQVVSLKSSSELSDLCCRHKLYPIRYVCQPCSAALCTVCVLEHDSRHSLIEIDRSMVEGRRKELKEISKVLNMRLNEIINREKLLTTIRQQQQSNLNSVQSAIREKCSSIISMVRETENKLLSEAAKKMELHVHQDGELHVERVRIEALQSEIRQVLSAPSYSTVLSHGDLLQKAKTVTEHTLPGPVRTPPMISLRFEPTSDEMNIGCLSEIRGDGDIEMSEPSTKRVSSILSALSPSKTKHKRLKGHHELTFPNTPVATSTSGATVSSPSKTSSTTPSPPSSPTRPTSSEEVKPESTERATVLLTIREQGGWPGRISQPCAAIFLPSRELVVAEQNRLQVFDATTKQSKRILAWGKIQPAGLALSSIDHNLVITCKKDLCVKVMAPSSGDILSIWGSFAGPAGIAVTSCGHAIITDTERRCVTVHALSDGTILRHFSCCQLSFPYSVAVYSDLIIVSDSSDDHVKIIDSENGTVRSSFNFTGGPYGHLRRPHGICSTTDGNILVADRDNHRVAMFSTDGKFIKNVLTRHDGIKYPSHLNLQTDSDRLVLVESNSAGLGQNGHFCVKIFHVPGMCSASTSSQQTNNN
ncbi:unnamed protein product [Dimorphilus gyrociliatus]|uniref:Uncharacterized protein n=1 Tax=Dimorphilus gyrociliatus TaxID=2664684 RepID=A0A7I8VZR0_9ANNE|nr:unnamed protein product [Dimorphilus gyrociliatus]